MKRMIMKRIKITAVLLSLGFITSACGGNASGTSGTAGTAGTAPDEPAETGTGQIAGEITVACYDTMSYQTFLEDAAKLFEEKYPGTKVNIDCFSEMPEIKTFEQDGMHISSIQIEDDSQGRADYISKTSTALMSGQGADLLAMDVLPVYKYVESGQLADLSEYMNQDPGFNKSDYRENILNSLTFQNGTWFLPLDYGFDYYTYDSTLMDEQQSSQFGANQAFTSKQLMELGKTLFDGTNRIFSTPAYSQKGGGDLFSLMFRENYRHFINMDTKTANFDDGEFKALINYVKELAEEGYIPKRAGKMMNPEDLTMLTVENQTNRFLFKARNLLSLIQQTYTGPDLKLMIATSNAEKGIETDDEIAGIWSDEAGIVPFSYEQAFGINANSPNKELAWEFLKFLLSYEIQASPGTFDLSLPIHNEARRDKAESTYRMLLTDGGELDQTQKESLQAYTDVVETMSDRINGYTVKDTTIQDMVTQEIGYFFDGNKTADEVCQVLQNKVGLYLNE